MSEDLTEKLPKNGNDTKILTAIKDLEKKVDNLEKKVDERLHDTRPIWHRVVADIGELQAGQKRLEEGQKGMREDIIELSNTVRQVNRDQLVNNDVVRRIQLDFHNIDERLHKLIVNRNQPNSST
jgi:outer membrane murein-binding lipoprotein Lpp